MDTLVAWRKNYSFYFLPTNKFLLFDVNFINSRRDTVHKYVSFSLDLLHLCFRFVLSIYHKLCVKNTAQRTTIQLEQRVETVRLVLADPTRWHRDPRPAL